MSTVTGGTKTTTSLTMLQYLPGANSAADVQAINAAMRVPTSGAFGSAAATGCGRFENGVLYLPDRGQNTISSAIQLQANDWIAVDGAGWPIIIPNAIFSTSWQHS